MLTDQELTEAYGQINAEVERRRVLSTAPDQADDLAAQWAQASGRVDGDAWVQPTAAFDAYPTGAVVTHGGKTRQSLTAANVWEPGISGWREVVEDGGTPAVWVHPTGAHDAYKTGDRVTFEGKTYESLIDANTWSPTAYPQGWKQIT